MSGLRSLDGQQSLFAECPHEYCRRCGRRLRGRMSAAQGIGPVCRTRRQTELVAVAGPLGKTDQEDTDARTQQETR